MLFGKKKDKTHKGDIFLTRGIYLTKPVMNNGGIVMNCFWRSLIVCLLTFGTVGGFLSAFDISYNIGMVVVAYFLLSIYFSFLYATPKMIFRDLGYIVFFVFFLGAIYIFRIYANSGFYTVINHLLVRSRSYFNLSGIQEYEVEVDNGYLTVAIVAIFIGLVMIIVLNIWMYSTMSLGWTLLFTFPLLLVPIYMEETPDLLYCMALCVGYIAVMVFKGNGHYVVFAWDTPFRVKGIRKDKVTYTQDAGVFRQVILTFSIMFLCIVLLTEMFVSIPRFMGMFQHDDFRDKTKESIGNFILLGFDGLFNHYASTGGLSGGKLGGVSTVRADYRTDLEVTFTPYSQEAIYLKGYTGGRYGNNEWESIYKDEIRSSDRERRNFVFTNLSDVDIFCEESLKKEAEILDQENVAENPYAADAIMDVKNVGANEAYLYYPYYTLFNDYNMYVNHSININSQGLKRDTDTSYHYYPKFRWENGLMDVRPKDIDTGDIEPVFLEVPAKNKQVIDDEIVQIGLKDTMSEKEIIEAVANYFQDNIPYTLKPGATPRNADFVNYFLQKNRKGYCAHFASAATLIFREMGIPARYIEGYAFSMENAMTGEEDISKDYYRYYQGYSVFGETPVMKVEVSDAMAHAWVEVYVQGFGWKQVEVTPSSMESLDDDIWSTISDLTDLNAPDLNGNVNGFDVDLKQFFFIVYIVLGVMLLSIVVRVVRMIVRKVQRYMRCHQENKTEATIAVYTELCESIRVCDPSFLLCKSHKEQLAYMEDQYGAQIDVEQMADALERISFSQQSEDQQELMNITAQLIAIQKRMCKFMNWKNKIKLMMR